VIRLIENPTLEISMQAKKRVKALQRWIVGAVILLLLFVGAYFVLVPKTEAAQQQPIAFNHEIMVQLGITCEFCHTEARRSEAAGMPSVQKCMGCHQYIATNTPAIGILTGYWQRKEPIPWVRVNVLPRFVYFSHEVHVTVAGLACEKCHGDVGHMQVDVPVVTMDMGWCLSCHEKQPNAPQLKDCVVCHQ
jgi:c(7)-type cytochrome triheme protein